MPQIKLEARPHAVALDTAKVALIVVDMQNDYGSKGGLFDHAGMDITSIQQVVPVTALAIAAARKARIKVIYLKMGFRPDLSDMGSDDAPNPWGTICRAATMRRRFCRSKYSSAGRQAPMSS